VVPIQSVRNQACLFRPAPECRKFARRLPRRFSAVSDYGFYSRISVKSVSHAVALEQGTTVRAPPVESDTSFSVDHSG
jgi:hypothetical protein